MMPQMLLCPIAVISITGLYTAWNRIRPRRWHGQDDRLRERVAWMLWVAATRILRVEHRSLGAARGFAS